MDLIIFERKAFEEFATKIEQFILRVSNSPVVKGGRKKTNNWLDHQDVCQKLKISKEQQQLLADLLEHIDGVGVTVRELEGRRASETVRRLVAGMTGADDAAS